MPPEKNPQYLYFMTVYDNAILESDLSGIAISENIFFINYYYELFKTENSNLLNY